MTKTPLNEYFAIDYGSVVLTESANSVGPIVLRNVILQRADAQNQNGRVYPRPILEREVQRYLVEHVRTRSAVGALDHPEERTEITLATASHLITNIYWDGQEVRGDVEILPTPMGNIVKELIKSRVRIGISSRGVGSVESEHTGSDQVQDDFKLICFDIVSTPSTQGAFLNESLKYDAVAGRAARINDMIGDFFEEFQRGARR